MNGQPKSEHGSYCWCRDSMSLKPTWAFRAQAKQSLCSWALSSHALRVTYRLYHHCSSLQCAFLSSRQFCPLFPSLPHSVFVDDGWLFSPAQNTKITHFPLKVFAVLFSRQGASCLGFNALCCRMMEETMSSYISGWHKHKYEWVWSDLEVLRLKETKGSMLYGWFSIS